MKKYIGTKTILAEPMTRKEYNDYRGWVLPVDEDGTDEGYLVEYTDGGKPNHPKHKGYISWSPKDVFDRAYRQTKGMTFGQAIEALKAGKKVSRKGWNGKGMFLAIQKGSVINSEQARGGVAKYLADDGQDEIKIGDHIDMKAADGSVVVGWLASQTDMLSEDWEIVE